VLESGWGWTRTPSSRVCRDPEDAASAWRPANAEPAFERPPSSEGCSRLRAAARPDGELLLVTTPFSAEQQAWARSASATFSTRWSTRDL